MTLTLRGKESFSLESFEAVAFHGESVTLSEEARQSITRGHEAFQRFLEQNAGKFIYSVTSGSGPDAKKQYSLDEARARLATQPWAKLSFGGPDLPSYVSRGTIFCQLAILIEGHTAMDPRKAEAIARMLDGDVPSLPERGLTAGGELMSLFTLFSHLTLQPDHGLGAGNGDNGSPLSAAMAACAAILSPRRLAFVERVLALLLTALGCTDLAAAAATQRHWDDADETGARRFAELGGEPSGPNSPSALELFASVFYLVSAARRAVANLQEIAELCMHERGSNPSYLPPSPRHPFGRVISHGGYHNALVAPALDEMATAWTNLGSMLHLLIIRAHQGWASGLPDRLLPPGTNYVTGSSTTYLEYVPNDFVAEMQRLAQPTLLNPWELAASTQDDVGIPAPLAFRMERQVAACFDATVVTAAVTASQALSLGNTPLEREQGALLDAIRKLFPVVSSLRNLGDEQAKALASMSAAIEAGEGPLAPYTIRQTTPSSRLP
ncbi:aromatic amino acid lyase [Planotetraspora sp. GP83]|uniref:aromatic amino acid lyase n=1 Tax=Planotetraspora sp. GP83 TaxID=3156264 RepID=UPI00351490F7